ncbi:MAG: hypothetical protein AB1716_17045, partial [Planctomycetota bacterium]
VTPATNLVSSGVQGGPFDPNQRVYTLTNTGGQALNWTAAKTQNWVTLSATGGALNAGGSTTVTVSINANANSLAVGSYADTVTFTNATNGSGNTMRGVSLSVNAPPGALAVTPATNLVSSGVQGGPFDPNQRVYTLTNTGGQALNWTAAKTQGWVTLSAASGALNAGGSTNVTVSINANANSLAVGSYADTVTFTNATNGSGNTTRGVSLSVSAPPGALAVTPATNLVSSGVQGGPFDPNQRVYTLTNTGGQALNWTAAKTQGWVTLSAASGALNAGGSTNVTVSINANANSLAVGGYADTVSFTNTTTGAGSTTRGVSLTVTSGGQMASSISQYGITWTFDRTYQVGQYSTGDWWVVGPVTVSSVTPAWDGTKNGSMIDPVGTASQSNWQALDTRAGGFSASLRTTFPVTISPSTKPKSLLSCIGRASQYAGGANQVVSAAAVLTVVVAAPPADAFRPCYAAGSKTTYRASNVNYSLLPSLTAPAGGAPDYVVTGRVARPWIDFGPKVTGAQVHPDENMPPYPRDSAQQVAELSLLCCVSGANQHVYTNRLIQLGIDLYDVALVNDDAFRAYGGFGSGRKWPILFAGIMLGDPGMLQPPMFTDSLPTIHKFGEDGHTYYGQATAQYPAGQPLWGWDCDSVGLHAPWWGNHDCRDPNGLLWPEQLINGGGYRGCCTSATWTGQALAARLLNAQGIWGHPAFFEYVDRWVADGGGNGNTFPYGTNFVRDMWVLYR